VWGVIQRLTYEVVTERGKQAVSNLQKCLICLKVAETFLQRADVNIE
jgi:hypothetical protein